MGAPDAAAGDASVGQSINADAFGPSRMFARTRECTWSKLLPSWQSPKQAQVAVHRAARAPRHDVRRQRLDRNAPAETEQPKIEHRNGAEKERHAQKVGSKATW